MQELLKSNIYDVEETIAIVGSCLKRMQPVAFGKIEELTKRIYTLCLEEFHINMAITKVGAMLRTNKVKKIIFVTVDKSPHCVQMHYIGEELKKMMDLKSIEFRNFVAVDDELIEISDYTISLSKNLKELSGLN